MTRQRHRRANRTSRRRGGQELPNEVQDRPEQNAGYDAAVRGEGTAGRLDTVDEARIDPIGEGHPLTIVPDEESDLARPERADERAEQSAIADVRRRERQGR